MNMLVKRVRGAEYLIKDFMATRMGRGKFEMLQHLNPELLGEWEFCASKDVDFTWWDRCHKKLTPSAIKQADFRVDWSGKVQEW